MHFSNLIRGVPGLQAKRRKSIARGANIEISIVCDLARPCRFAVTAQRMPQCPNKIGNPIRDTDGVLINFDAWLRHPTADIARKPGLCIRPRPAVQLSTRRTSKPGFFVSFAVPAALSVLEAAALLMPRQAVYNACTGKTKISLPPILNKKNYFEKYCGALQTRKLKIYNTHRKELILLLCK